MCSSDSSGQAALTIQDIAKYEQMIQETAPLLLQGHIDSNNIKEFDVGASLNASSLTFSKSAPEMQQHSSKSMLATNGWVGDQTDSEETKNRALIRVIATGMKNHMPRLLSILNDLNGRMLFEEYKRDPQFHDARNDGIMEEKMDKMDNDEDATSEYEVPASRWLALRDSIPIMNNSRLGHHKSRHWRMLNKLPIHLALRTYHERLVPPIDFCPRYLIKDSISQYLQRISMIMCNVMDLLKDSGMPLQFDLVIFPKHVVRNPLYKGNIGDNNRNEADSRESRDDSETAKPLMPSSADLSARKMEHLEDCIGAVSDRLLSLPRSYDDHLTKNENDGTLNVFTLDDGLTLNRSARALCEEMKKIPFFKYGARHGRYVCVIERSPIQVMDDDQVNNDQVNDVQKKTVFNLKETELKPIVEDEKELHLQKETADKGQMEHIKKPKETGSPRADARKSEADERPDLLHFFQPPQPHGDIIDGVAMTEAMHSDTLEYLLPAIEREKCPIGARHLCGGKMFCISFHMLSKDEIKCYLYIDQKGIRLTCNQGLPLTELMHILPHYFDDEEFVPLSIRDALLKAKFDNEVIQQVDLWLQKWPEREREMQLINDLSQVVLKTEKHSDQIFIENPTPLGKYIIERCNWNELDNEKRNAKLLLFYRVLRELFGIPMQDDKWSKLSNVKREYSYSFFSTVDREYDEIRDKLVSDDVL